MTGYRRLSAFSGAMARSPWSLALAAVLGLLVAATPTGTAFASGGSGHHASVNKTHVTPSYGCSGNGCNNTDPASTGCASSSSTNSVYQVGNAAALSGGEVQLMYSSGCGTNWSRVSSLSGGVHYIWAQINRASGTDGGALSYSASWGPSIGTITIFYSNQVYSPHNAAQACGTFNVGGPNACTNYY